MGTLSDLIQAARTQAEAGPLWEQVLEQAPDHAEALLFLGDQARRGGRAAEAGDLLQRCVIAAPRLVPARCALANLLLYQGHESEAAPHLAVAAEMAPDQAYVWRDIGLWRRVTGDAAGALAAFEQCLTLDPIDPAALLGRALCLLRLGRWEAGFAAYHHRWSVASRPPRHQNIPIWRGQPLAGRRLLVWDEQGAGDSLMCARLTTSLIAAGADVTLELPPSLIPLFGDDRLGRILARDDNPGHMDFQVALLDLPGLLGLTPATIPWSGPYIAAATVPTWAERMPRRPGKPRIGISWAGNPAHPGDRWRSPGLATMLPLLDRTNVDWYALQVASGRNALATTPLPPHVQDLGAAITSWVDTASILDQLDLLITPDSALAHLGGAMGRPVWTLIATDTDWRWQETGNRTGWYPSMRLFRQQKCGDWTGVINRIRAALPAPP